MEEIVEEIVEEIKKIAGKRACQRLPAFFWPIRDETKGH